MTNKIQKEVQKNIFKSLDSRKRDKITQKRGLIEGIDHEGDWVPIEQIRGKKK